MSSYINSIKLVNWFNYAGDDNLIPFTKGPNIIVGTNNAGKSKLFNAFKYIIHDEVILKQIENDRNVSKPTKLNKNNILEAFNHKAFSELEINEKSKMGVELMFTKERRGSDPKTWILSKFIHFRKISDNEISELEEIKEVYQFLPITNSRRKRDESFSTTVDSLIPKIYSDFFLVEGEQMGMMTPLRGVGLKTTINNLTSIRAIDNNAEVFKKLNDWSKKEYRSIINQEAKGNKKLQDLELDKTNKEREIEEESEIYNRYEILIESEEETLEIKSKEYAKSKKDKELLGKLEILRNEEKNIEERINQFQRNYLNSLTNTEFVISKLENDEKLNEKIIEFLENIHWFSTERRSEISKNIDEKELKYLKKFVHNQPQPEILEEMVKENVCYVCTSPMTADGVSFIENKLIPHLKGEYENEDEELKFLGNVHNSMNEITNASKKYFPFFENCIDEKLEDYSLLTTELHAKKEEIANFINQYGDESDLKSEGNILEFYKNLSDKIRDLRVNRDISKRTLVRYKEELNTIKKEKIKIIQDNGEGEKENRWRLLDEFFEELALTTEKIKETVYNEFAKNLEEKASKRFQSLMKHNPSIKGQKLTVNISKDNEHSTDYSFKIQLKDNFGTVLSQTGGASSTIEPLSAVFGLIDMSENKTKAPFIADAPISRMTPDSKFSFFETILEDTILGQTIIILMDLWDDKNEGLNLLGEDVKRLLDKNNESSIQFITPNDSNTGVKISIV